MRLKEQRLWDRMRDNKHRLVRLERVENMLAGGFPDVIAKHAKCRLVIPIELKAVDSLPKRPGTRVFGDEGLNVDQKNWLLDWRGFGGSALIICAVGSAHQAFHWAIDGIHGDHFNEMTKLKLDEIALCRGVGKLFWPQLWQLMGDMR